MERTLGYAYIALVVFLLTGWGLIAAYGQQYPNCTEFGFQISTSCCCTAGCCAEAKEDEFRHVGGNTYRSNVTGQLINRTGWSPDGRFIRCACDQIEGVWQWHPKAFVRCIYPPLPSS